MPPNNGNYDDNYDPYSDPESPFYDPYSDPESPLYDPYLDPDGPLNDPDGPPLEPEPEPEPELEKSDDCEEHELEPGYCLRCCWRKDKQGNNQELVCDEVECSEESNYC